MKYEMITPLNGTIPDYPEVAEIASAECSRYIVPRSFLAHHTGTHILPPQSLHPPLRCYRPSLASMQKLNLITFALFMFILSVSATPALAPEQERIRPRGNTSDDNSDW
jgi:hypothetical protein